MSPVTQLYPSIALRESLPRMRRGALLFPWKLHKMLDDAEESTIHGNSVVRFDSIVSWLPCGKMFQVHDQIRFEKLIAPLYFDQHQYKSFQRQLNIYGFQRVDRGPCKGAYFHDQFVRGKPDLCHNMVRTKIKGRQSSCHILEKARMRSIQHNSMSLTSSLPNLNVSPSTTTQALLSYSMNDICTFESQESQSSSSAEINNAPWPTFNRNPFSNEISNSVCSDHQHMCPNEEDNKTTGWNILDEISADEADWIVRIFLPTNTKFIESSVDILEYPRSGRTRSSKVAMDDNESDDDSIAVSPRTIFGMDYGKTPHFDSFFPTVG